MLLTLGGQRAWGESPDSGFTCESPKLLDATVGPEPAVVKVTSFMGVGFLPGGCSVRGRYRLRIGICCGGSVFVDGDNACPAAAGALDLDRKAHDLEPESGG